MKQYLETLQDIHSKGIDHSDRTGTGRRSIFGVQLKFNLKDGFPLVTTRNAPYKSMIRETLWFIKGSRNIADLRESGCNFWNSWAVNEASVDKFVEKYEPSFGDSSEMIKLDLMTNAIDNVGVMYGSAWRNAPRTSMCQLWPTVNEDEVASDKLAAYKQQYAELEPKYEDGTSIDWGTFLTNCHYSTVDQLQYLILNLKTRPHSSRHVVSAWLPEFVPFEHLSPQENVMLGRGALAACHAMFQCFVTPPVVEGGKAGLNLMVFIRSNDFPVGAVTNIAQYALMLAMLAHVTGMEACELVYSVGDCHYYSNQAEGVKEQLTRVPGALPKIIINPDVTDFFKITEADISIVDYNPQGIIQYPLSV